MGPKVKFCSKGNAKIPPLKSEPNHKPMKVKKTPKPVSSFPIPKNPYIFAEGSSAKTSEKSISEIAHSKVNSNNERLDLTGKRQRQGAVKLPEFKPPRKKRCEISDCNKCNAPKCGLCSSWLLMTNELCSSKNSENNYLMVKEE
jgi:hypothetical protein